MIKFNFALLLFILISCGASTQEQSSQVVTGSAVVDTSEVVLGSEKLFHNDEIVVGAAQMDVYIDLLTHKKVGVVGNQSSLIGQTHLVDTLVGVGVDVVRVFSPEHGFRGTADAGEKVDNEIDQKTGLPIVSLYGNNKKPTADQLKGIDVLLFDIQDVGVRFYTYISTLHYIMEAAAEQGIEVIVLDRPNPNGHYVAGPVLEKDFTSFIGMHEVPVVHGMTIGEYAKMLNAEGWLSNGVQCNLQVIPCKGWDHHKFYRLPVAPSPNLPNMTAVYLYPSLCFFEGTVVSIGRGTDYPFQVIGHPNYQLDSTASDFSFTPQPNPGAKHPKLENEHCYGVDLHKIDLKSYRSNGKLDLSYLIEFYANLDMGNDFFLTNNFINLLAGTDDLKKQILSGTSMESIEQSWENDVVAFREIRKKYLLYAE